MEKELYKALALVLLEPRADQYGNVTQSPLKIAIDKWASDKREDIAAAIVKKLGVNELAEKVAEKIIYDLTRKSWDGNYDADNLRKAVNEKLAEKLAEKELEKLNNQSLKSN